MGLKQIKEIKDSKSWPFKEKCDRIANKLFKEYIAEEKRGEGCGSLMLEWTKDRFYGLIIQEHVSVFNSVWNILTERGNVGQSNRYVYGDVDVGVWVEKVKNPNDKKVIVSTCYCSCADDNTHTYILTGFDSEHFGQKFLEFKCRTVWPIQNSRGGYRVKKSKDYPNGWFSWGDDRDIKIPSIKTYRDRDFKFSYGDSRDKGFVFDYRVAYDGPSSESSSRSEKEILYALRSLNTHLLMLSDYESNKM